MNRIADDQESLFSDYTIVGNVKYAVNENLSLFAKSGYDENTEQPNNASHIYDQFVVPGTKHFFYGAGMEYFPIKNSKEVRLHGYIASDNNNPQYVTFNIGIRWRMNILER